LGVDRVGVHDNFFELGGDSILAIQITARAADAFGVEVDVGALMATPTIAALAAQIADALDIWSSIFDPGDDAIAGARP